MQTFLQHRYASHGAFSMSKPWERFFYITAYITQGSSYISPRIYAIMHRMHHAYTDTAKDPHSPSYDSNIFIMMRHTRQVSSDLFTGKLEAESRFLKNLKIKNKALLQSYCFPYKNFMRLSLTCYSYK